MDVSSGASFPRLRHYSSSCLTSPSSSEFGIPAFPSRHTIEYWLEDGQTSEDEKQRLRYAQSKSMQQHNKAGSHERRFAVLMSENFRYTSDLDEHIYNTQLLQ